jgi:hypothetical protein
MRVFDGFLICILKVGLINPVENCSYVSIVECGKYFLIKVAILLSLNFNLLILLNIVLVLS